MACTSLSLVSSAATLKTAQALALPLSRSSSLARSPFLAGSSSLRLCATSAAAPVTSGATARRNLNVRAFREGEKLPGGELKYFDKDGNIKSMSIDSLTKGKRVVLFGLPGAFTPVCSSKMLPEFVKHADELKAKGVDTIACVAVNDAYVMKAWAESAHVGDKVLMLADGNGDFTEKLGVAMDYSDKGMGKRSARFSLLAEDGTVKKLNVEKNEGGLMEAQASGPDKILEAL